MALCKSSSVQYTVAMLGLKKKLKKKNYFWLFRLTPSSSGTWGLPRSTTRRGGIWSSSPLGTYFCCPSVFCVHHSANSNQRVDVKDNLPYLRLSTQKGKTALPIWNTALEVLVNSNFQTKVGLWSSSHSLRQNSGYMKRRPFLVQSGKSKSLA